MEEVVVSSGRGSEGLALAWDLRTGTLLNSYKPNASDPNSLQIINNDYLVVIQNNSTSIFFWTLKKSQVLFRSTPPEKLSALMTTKDGVYCIGGGASGSLHVWNIASGSLLKSWEGHYKKVSSIAVTEDGSFVISGGEDAIVNAWSLADLLDKSQSRDASSSTSSLANVKPFHSWSEHSLPVTHVYCGFGGVNCRVVSVSLDRTCKLWDIPSRSLLCSIIFPTGLTCSIMDAHERNLFVGGMDGRIFQIELYTSRAISEDALGEQTQHVLQGHKQSVTALALSFDGSLLLSSSEDGTCSVWDTQSRQKVRDFDQHKGGVTNVAVILKPPNWVNLQEKKAVPLVQPFKRYPNAASDTNKDSSLRLNSTNANAGTRDADDFVWNYAVDTLRDLQRPAEDGKSSGKK